MDKIDPGAKRKAEKHEAAGREIDSFEYVAREWLQKQVHIWSAKHAADVLRRLEANLFPEIGGEPIAEITAPKLLTAVRKIEVRGANDLAHRPAIPACVAAATELAISSFISVRVVSDRQKIPRPFAIVFQRPDEPVAERARSRGWRVVASMLRGR